MAFQGTHIRFALDLMEKYEVKDIEAFISGTLYPDSRYMTGIERELTHSDRFLEKDFATDDFHKGWQVHLLCDKLQQPYITAITKSKEETAEQRKEKYISDTAVKLLQEMFDLKMFSAADYVQYVKVVDVPNGEDLEKIKEFYGLLHDYFSKDFNIENCRPVFLAFGISREIIDAIIAYCIKMQGDKTKMHEIEKIYSKMSNDLVKLV